ncbi:hypothetical protein VTO42DRAFT_4553 [Malbranchea cinnamomea]
MAPIKAVILSALLGLASMTVVEAVPKVDFDVLVVGGGPGGLSALSGLGRVRRKALLYDSGEYRNGPTRHMHDVIGNDGTVPRTFRALAKEQISKYKTTEIRNGTVVSVQKVGSYFRATDEIGESVTSRKVILATGMKDVLPSTPGLQEAWGNGIFWCPWCDGYEHRDQPFGILGRLRDVMGSVLEMMTLNSDIIAFVNGTWTPDEEAILEQKYPDWFDQLQAYDIRLDNRTIVSIDRLQDGGQHHDPEEHKEYDLFRINFSEGESVIRSAFITNFPAVQRSTLPAQMGLTIDDNNKIKVDPSSMRTNVKGVFAVGDANNDNSTNVPHAMYSGKRAAVFVHVELAREESLDSIGKREVEVSERALQDEALRLIGDNLEPLWKRARLEK